MREVWLAVLKIKPEDNNQEGMGAYMSVHYLTIDKAQEAHRRLERCKLSKGTERA